MRKSYRWGILAPGKIAHKFANGLQFVPGAELYAVGSRDIIRAREFANQYHAPVSYGSYEELVSDPEVDIIYIANPHSFHMKSTLLCLKHGKAVLCEKPLAINSHQVKTMIQTARENNTFLMEALWSRFLPNIIKTKQLIDSNIIGKVSHLKADFGFHATFDPKARTYNPELGGGALLDIGIYPLFFAIYLFGMPTRIDAIAELAETGVDESCQVKLSFADGTTADLFFTYMENTPVEARIMGNGGEIMLPNRWYQPVNLHTSTGTEDRETVIDFVGNGYNYQAVEVQKCLEQDQIESPNWSHNDSIQLMELMDEVRRQCGISYPADQLNQ